MIENTKSNVRVIDVSEQLAERNIDPEDVVDYNLGKDGKLAVELTDRAAAKSPLIGPK